MPKLTSAIDANSSAFTALDAHNRRLRDELRDKVAKAALGGSEKSRERHVSRGKLLPRDRVERLLDPGSPFLEVGQLAANGMYKDEALAGLLGAPHGGLRHLNAQFVAQAPVVGVQSPEGGRIGVDGRGQFGHGAGINGAALRGKGARKPCSVPRRDRG